MPLVPAFSLALTSDPSAILVTDLSTGSDGAVVGRKINFYDVSNNPFGNSPYDFPNFPASTSITLNPFQADKAINVITTWINNVGVPLYTVAQLYVSVGYAKQFYSGLTRNQTSQPTIVNDQQYFSNKNKLHALIVSALDAITNMQDIVGAQNCIALYTPLLQDSTLYF